MKKRFLLSIITSMMLTQCGNVGHCQVISDDSCISDCSMNAEKVEKIYEAANGAFWLTKEERKVLRDNGFVVSYILHLPGWEGVECGTMFNYRVTCHVNNPHGKRATLKEIKDILTNSTVYEAANRTFWLTTRERRILRDNGFVVSYGLHLPGWEGVECGELFKCRITCHVNNPHGKRATLKEIKDVLGQ